jgi:hypothetical protein
MSVVEWLGVRGDVFDDVKLTLKQLTPDDVPIRLVFVLDIANAREPFALELVESSSTQRDLHTFLFRFPSSIQQIDDFRLLNVCAFEGYQGDQLLFRSVVVVERNNTTNQSERVCLNPF